MAATEKNMVTMTDGRTVGFNKKQRLVRNASVADNGDINVTLDFVNGQTRQFSLPVNSPNYSRSAAFGLETKFGDQIGNEADIDDAVLAVENLMERLAAGEWYVGRAPGSFSGASVLAKALIEASGKSADEIKAFLASKSHAEKLALRQAPQLKPIIERLEATRGGEEKAVVDTGALLGELGVGEKPAKAQKREPVPAE